MEVQESLRVADLIFRSMFVLPYPSWRLRVKLTIKYLSKWQDFPKVFSNRPRKMDASITREKAQNCLDWEHEIEKTLLLLELLNKQGDNIQPWHTPFPIWNQSVVPCPVRTVASWPAYGFLKRQVRWSGIPISFRIFHSLLWSTQSKALA